MEDLAAKSDEEAASLPIEYNTSPDEYLNTQYSNPDASQASNPWTLASSFESPYGGGNRSAQSVVGFVPESPKELPTRHSNTLGPPSTN